MRYFVQLVLLILPSALFAQYKFIRSATPNKELTFWAASVVDRVAWVSANKGTVALTSDGGTKWVYKQVKGFEDREFRSIYAFNDKIAVIANVGSPASILRTTDGGDHWEVVYRNESPHAFIDGIDFWSDGQGLMYGDPIDGRMLLVKTEDGGKTWTDVLVQFRPRLVDGQASFASSGTGIRCLPNGKVVIATGGKVSRLYTSNNYGRNWTTSEPMLRQGSDTGGIFSVAYDLKGNGVLVGGDFKDSLATERSMYMLVDSDWKAPTVKPGGTRWCVEHTIGSSFIAVGPTGLDTSNDGGKTWSPSKEHKDLHVVRKSRTGHIAVIAGRNGKLAVLY